MVKATKNFLNDLLSLLYLIILNDVISIHIFKDISYSNLTTQAAEN